MSSRRVQWPRPSCSLGRSLHSDCPPCPHGATHPSLHRLPEVRSDPDVLSGAVSLPSPTSSLAALKTSPGEMRHTDVGIIFLFFNVLRQVSRTLRRPRSHASPIRAQKLTGEVRSDAHLPGWGKRHGLTGAWPQTGRRGLATPGWRFRKATTWLTLGTELLVLNLLTGCLYLEEVGPPIQENHPPEFYNWIPLETSVEIAPQGMTFYAYYSDPDEADQGELEMQWYLNGRAQGNGNQVQVWLEDLGDQTTGVLAAVVSDPHDAQDIVLWRLEVASELSQGD